MEIAVITWLVFWTLLGALIGKQKGRADSGVVWGLLLGPIGCLITALLPDRRKVYRCPACFGEVDGEASRCRHCGIVFGDFYK